jgi:hypothetical protein
MSWRGLIIFLLVLLLFLVVCGRQLKNGPNYRGRIRKVLDELGYSENFNLIYAIARHESADFSSSVFKKCQNAFGLKTYQMTPCMAPAAEGVGLYYMKFESLEGSVKAFVRWLEKRGGRPGMTDEEIKSVMQKGGYFTDPEYFNKVQRWMKKI